MPGQDRFTFDCQWRPSSGKPPTAVPALDDVNYQGSEIANNVDMTWLGQIDHFDEVVDTKPETKPQLDIPDVPDMSLMPIIPSTSKHGKCTWDLHVTCDTQRRVRHVAQGVKCCELCTFATCQTRRCVSHVTCK